MDDKAAPTRKSGTVPEPEGRAAENSGSVQMLSGVLGLFTTPDIGPETEQEIKTRRELNEAVHRMLILGLAVSTTVITAGLVLTLIQHHPLPSRVSGFRELVEGLRNGSASGLLSLGILLLIASPVLRVIGSLVEFLRKRDWRYAAISMTVLAILAISVFVGAS